MGMPHSVDAWSRAVHETILRFEPRVKSVNIDMDGFDAEHQTLKLRLAAMLVDGTTMNLSAVFDSSGAVRIGGGGSGSCAIVIPMWSVCWKASPI